MKILRRQFLHLTASAASLTALSRIASAMDYPTRPVRIVVPLPAGTGPDIIARLMGQWLSERLGQQFIIDNRPGAAGNIGTEVAAKALPDGYTFVIVISNNAINATLYPNLNFNFARDIVSVARIGGTPFVMTVNSAFPAKTVPEFMLYAKANPGKINMASNGTGTGGHVSSELFKMMTGVAWVHVPYRGNYMFDLISGHVQLAFPPIAQVIEYIRDGRLHALAVTTPVRSNALPDVPSVKEFVPGYEAIGWYGICAPRGTPAEIIEKLNREITAGVADPNIKARLVDLGIEPSPMTSAEFGRFIDSEIEKWGNVVKFAGIKAE